MDLVDTPPTPSPNRGADKVNRLDACGLQPRLQTQIEIRRIHTHEHIRPLFQQTVAQLTSDTVDFAKTAHHFHVEAMHSQLLIGPPGLKTMGGHVWPANTLSRQGGPTSFHPAQQQAGQQVPGGLAGHHGDVQSIRHVQRTMPRVALARKLTMLSTSTSASGSCPRSASISARAASSVNPLRYKERYICLSMARRSLE